jgi:hypothetical protein
MAVPIALGRGNQLVDFGFGQVLAGAQILIGAAQRSRAGGFGWLGEQPQGCGFHGGRLLVYCPRLYASVTFQGNVEDVTQGARRGDVRAPGRHPPP